MENCEPQAYVEMLHGDFKDVCKSTASLVRKSWKRHKSFDMDILRHSSPALLSTINQLSGGNDGSSSKRNNNNNSSSSSSSMRSSRDNKRNRRNRGTNRSDGNFHDIEEVLTYLQMMMMMMMIVVVVVMNDLFLIDARLIAKDFLILSCQQHLPIILVALMQEKGIIMDERLTRFKYVVRERQNTRSSRVKL